MAQASQVMAPPRWKLRSTECFGRVVSRRTHEKCADLCMDRLRWVKVVQIVLSAPHHRGTTDRQFWATQDQPSSHHCLVIVSTILLVLNAYMGDVDPGQQAEKHKEDPGRLWDVQEVPICLCLLDLHDGHLDIGNGGAKRDELQARLVSICAWHPELLQRHTASQVLAWRQQGLRRSDAETNSAGTA